MEIMISTSLPIFFFLSIFLQLSESATILVDGVSGWKNPSVHVGDTVIFKHKYEHKLYIFRNENAFSLCNFSQSTLLTKLNSSYTWHPSRPGFFYFTFNNGSLKSCQDSEKLAVEVVSTPPPQSSSPLPELPSTSAPTPTPNPTTGGVISSSPSYQWPFRPREGATSPGPGPAATMQDKGGGGGPFINSNPAVPLPTGEVDSATIRPMQTSGQQKQAVVGFSTAEIVAFCAICFFNML